MEQAAIPTGVGAVLRAAREDMGMSVEEVAIRLKFAPRQITALEEENFQQLPELAFVRGFVRSYARLLQIDEVALLKLLPGAPVQEAATVKRVAADVLPGNSGRKQNLFWMGGILAVGVVVFLAWKYDAGDAALKHAPSAKSGSEAKPAKAAQGDTETPPGAESKALPETQTGAAAQPGSESHAGSVKQPAPVVANTVPAKPAASAPAATRPGARAHAASGVAATTEAGQHKLGPARPLRLEFDEDSWVEVKDGSGKILLSTLGKQGTSQTVSGSLPLSVTIGNAKGVRAYYKDESLDLGKHGEQEVARLRLE